MGYWQTNESPNLGQETRLHNNKKQRIYRIVDFVIPADQIIDLKECEKKDTYLDLVRESKKKTMEHKGDNCNNCD